MTALRYRLFPPNGGVYYCQTCRREDDWRPRVDPDGRFPVAYQCGCGGATVPARCVAQREPSDGEVAALFATLNDWFAARIEELEALHCRGAWTQAHALQKWLEDV